MTPGCLRFCCSAGLTANVIGSALGIQPRLRVRLDRPEMDGQEGAAFGLPLPVSALLLSGFDFAAMSPRRFPPPWQVEQAGHPVNFLGKPGITETEEPTFRSLH